MSDNAKKVPDHSLLSASIPASSEPPQVFAVSDLRAYIKPDLDEELGAASGGLADPGIQTVCTCVPVETCVCNVVTYYSGSKPAGSCGVTCTCQCTCTGTCVSLYWFPY